MTAQRRTAASKGTMLLERLSNARGVSGQESQVREILMEAVRDQVDECRVDSLGNLIVTKRARGSRRKPGPKVMLAAHMDEVGLMIVHHESNGHLRFSKVGGIDDRVLPSKVVLIGPDKVPGVVGVKPVHLLKSREREQVIATESMTIDIGAKTKEEAQGAVKVGDYATFATEFSEMGNDLVMGKALDDRAGCAALVELLRRDYPVDLYGVFTTQEEVGLRGAQVAAYAIAPDLALVLETTACDDAPKDKDLSPGTRLGAGPAITVADKTVIADRRLSGLLIDTAKDNHIPFQIKQPLIGGTDAGRIHLSQAGIRSAIVALPTRYLHSPVCMLSRQDYESMVALVTKTLPKLADGLF